MKEVIVKFEPFIFKQTVFIKDCDTEAIETKQVPQKDLLNFLSLIPDVKVIHFFGNEKFAKKIKDDCLTCNKFSKNVYICINK